MTQKNPTQFRGSKRGQSQISQNYSSLRGAASPTPSIDQSDQTCKRSLGCFPQEALHMWLHLCWTNCSKMYSKMGVAGTWAHPHLCDT